MQRQEGSGFDRSCKISLPPLKDALIFMSVVVVVAGAVAFVGLRLRTPNEGRGGTELGRMGEGTGLPDVLGNRCLDQVPKRL
jgi:hypothetical protein